MVLNIYPGTHFSSLKLLLKTNRYFDNLPLSRKISNRDSNYAISIGRHSVKIIMSNDFPDDDVKKIKNYIETVFANRSILITSSGEIPWMNDIQNVSVYRLNDE